MLNWLRFTIHKNVFILYVSVRSSNYQLDRPWIIHSVEFICSDIALGKFAQIIAALFNNILCGAGSFCRPTNRHFCSTYITNGTTLVIGGIKYTGSLFMISYFRLKSSLNKYANDSL